MPATIKTIDTPARTQVITKWTGGHADLLRQALRMTNESFAEHLGVVVRTVAYWRERSETVPKTAIQETLDAALERAPDRAKAQFAQLLAEHGKQADRVESPEISDPRTLVPVTSPPPAAQAIPRQRRPRLSRWCMKWPPRDLFPFKRELPLLSIQPH
jgi:DNA-binding transcriptional regulator YiaG